MGTLTQRKLCKCVAYIANLAPARTRARLAKSAAKVKKAKADGTYKQRTTGDTKNHFTRVTKQCNRAYRVKLAYNKVERLGPGACRPHEVEKHAAYKARLEVSKAATKAWNAARKAKK